MLPWQAQSRSKLLLPCTGSVNYLLAPASPGSLFDSRPEPGGLQIAVSTVLRLLGEAPNASSSRIGDRTSSLICTSASEASFLNSSLCSSVSVLPASFKVMAAGPLSSHYTVLNLRLRSNAILSSKRTSVKLSVYLFKCVPGTRESIQEKNIACKQECSFKPCRVLRVPKGCEPLHAASLLPNISPCQKCHLTKRVHPFMYPA